MNLSSHNDNIKTVDYLLANQHKFNSYYYYKESSINPLKHLQHVVLIN